MRIEIKGRQVGIILVAVAVAVFYAGFAYTQKVIALYEELHKTCSLPIEACPFKQGSLIPQETFLLFAVGLVVAGLGAYFLLRPQRPSAAAPASVVSPVFEKKKLLKTAQALQGDERAVFQLLVDAEGFAFQSDLINKTGFSKVKMTRVLDRLEGKGLVERKRRGMANAVILKHSLTA